MFDRFPPPICPTKRRNDQVAAAQSFRLTLPTCPKPKLPKLGGGLKSQNDLKRLSGNPFAPPPPAPDLGAQCGSVIAGTLISSAGEARRLESTLFGPLPFPRQHVQGQPKRTEWQVLNRLSAPPWPPSRPCPRLCRAPETKPSAPLPPPTPPSSAHLPQRVSGSH